MRFVRQLVCRAGAVLLAAAGAAKALVIVRPTEADIWSTDTTAANTLFFDVYVRNAAPGMYEPGLNISLATQVDSSVGTSVNLTEIDQLRPGGGYQLFLSDPADASVVYCTSDVFAVVAPPSSPNAAVSSDASPTANETPTSSGADPTSSDAATPTSYTSTEALAASTSATPSARSSPFHSAAHPRPHSLGPAVAPGSWEDQGFNLVVESSASLMRPPVQGTFLIAGAAAAFALLL
ncbi:hypothetical protein JCM3774_000533 [Rhodotorula dairenensis]